MWVYINDLGQVITNIPHGEIVRQGSTFHVYVAFDKNYFKKYFGREFALYSLERLTHWINDNIEATFSFKGLDTYDYQAERIFFEKVKLNENICSFIDKQWYIVFKYNGTLTDSEEFGNFPLNLRLSITEQDDQSNIYSRNVDVIGPIQINIEKTYGKKAVVNDVKKEQIDALLDYVKTYGKGAYKIKDIVFESYHSLANYCINDLADKEKTNLIIGVVNNSQVMALLNVSFNKVIMISSEGEILCSDGTRYYYITSSDVKIMNELSFGEQVKFVIENNKLVISDSSNNKTIIEPDKISKGILVGQPYLEEFATYKQQEAMPFIGESPPESINEKLNQIWFQVGEKEVESIENIEEEINAYSLRKPIVEEIIEETFQETIVEETFKEETLESEDIINNEYLLSENGNYNSKEEIIKENEEQLINIETEILIEEEI